MKKRVMTILLAGALIVSVSGCTIGNLQIEISDSSSSTGNTVSKDEVKDNGSKDPDDAKSFKEYVELKFGPVVYKMVHKCGAGTGQCRSGLKYRKRNFVRFAQRVKHIHNFVPIIFRGGVRKVKQGNPFP